MAPPAGTSSMLRSRRRDATLKPNRTLDRSASRGMLYENEELRLRTININAEVEKGQNYIKKLRRENEQLKREIWNLREEYERLENYVKSREQSENEEEDEDSCGEFSGIDELPAVEEPIDPTVTSETLLLETVVEEDDEAEDDDRPQQPEPEKDRTAGDEHEQIAAHSADQVNRVTGGDRIGDRDDVIADAAGPRRDAFGADPRDGTSAAVVTMMAEDAPAAGGDDGCGARLLQIPSQRDDGPQHGDSFPDGAAVLQPHTACFETGNNRQLHDLTVDEVIDAIQDVELRDKLRTVCLTDDRCYMTFANAECLERALHSAFRIRDVPVLLMDTGAGAIILSLTGVPDVVADKDVLKCLKKYGTIIGGVERKTARGGATGGERYVRVRLTLGAPRYLWFGSEKVIVRQLTEHETGTMNSIARRKSFRSQIKLNLKMADPSTASSSASANGSPTGFGGGGAESTKDTGGGGGGGGSGSGDGSGGGGGGGVGSTVATTAAVSVHNGFRFPESSKTATGPQTGELKTAASAVMVAAASAMNSKSTGSLKRTGKPGPCNNDRDGCPPITAGSAESPLRGRRRMSLMGFRRDTIKHRGGSVSRGEDADSDTSTICRRKLSATGHEGAEKVPWCGCWGNGCL
ncbi:Hypothetical protein CINCED_3A015476 [Cinara cedri]|uniref:Uncharacterized protein n=1 Tax=Cinara cedri TaxID=506608 RepID=A0A5E4MDD9_9HEMI|nr:Hypothetical protein CINCED_3A015476 [Cinara cedri]